MTTAGVLVSESSIPRIVSPTFWIEPIPTKCNEPLVDRGAGTVFLNLIERRSDGMKSRRPANFDGWTSARVCDIGADVSDKVSLSS